MHKPKDVYLEWSWMVWHTWLPTILALSLYASNTRQSPSYFTSLFSCSRTIAWEESGRAIEERFDQHPTNASTETTIVGLAVLYCSSLCGSIPLIGSGHGIPAMQRVLQGPSQPSRPSLTTWNEMGVSSLLNKNTLSLAETMPRGDGFEDLERATHHLRQTSHWRLGSLYSVCTWN